MTPSQIAAEHLGWCWSRGLHPADVCASVGALGDSWDDAVSAVLSAAVDTARAAA